MAGQAETGLRCYKFWKLGGKPRSADGCARLEASYELESAQVTTAQAKSKAKK
jgi:hypothetical protein